MTRSKQLKSPFLMSGDIMVLRRESDGLDATMTIEVWRGADVRYWPDANDSKRIAPRCIHTAADFVDVAQLIASLDGLSISEQKEGLPTSTVIAVRFI